jgi:ABC-type Mn2+/Zn2+ transport system ATPase subunit
MSFIEVKNLSVAFDGNTIIENVTFEVEKGEVVSIIGPNGSGKTTLVRAMLGFVEHKGTVKLNAKPFKEHLGDIGYVPQRFDFDRTFPISVEEFLAISGYKPDLPWRQEVYREFGIKDLLRKKLGTLSGGQTQRVLIASSLLKKPQILILDEPTAGVDIEGAASFYELVRHVNEEHNITVFLISHEINMISTTSTKVICVNRSMFCCGEPDKVMTKELLDRLYGAHFEMREHTH